MNNRIFLFHSKGIIVGIFIYWGMCARFSHDFSRFLQWGVLCIGFFSMMSGIYAQEEKKKEKRPSLYRAEGHLLGKRYQKAVDEIERYISNPPDKLRANAWLLRAKIYLDIQLSDKLHVRRVSPNAGVLAAESYKEVLALQKHDRTSLARDALRAIEQIWGNYIKRGTDSYDVSNYEDAYGYFQKASRVKEEDSLSLLYSGYLAQQLGDYDAARGHYNDLISMGKYDEGVYRALISIEQVSPQDSTTMLTLLDEALRLYPDNMEYMKQKMIVLSSRGMDSEARDILISALKKSPNDSWLLVNIAGVYDEKARELIRLEEYNEADLYLDSAELYYGRVLETDPTHFEANYNLAVVYVRRSRRYYDVVRKMSNREYAEKGKALEKKGEPLLHQALPYIQRAEKIDPEDVDVWIVLQEIYSLLNDQEKKDFYQTLIEVEEEG